MVSVQQLYELWAGDDDLDEELSTSPEPRGPDWLFELFARLEPRPEELVADVGCRDARHAIRIAADHVWGVDQLLGKLEPTVYVWERRG